GNEVDLIWKRGEQAAGFEIKSSNVWQEKFNKGLNVLLQTGDIGHAFGVYRGERVLKVGKGTVLPYKKAIEMALEGSFVPAI
ncbi:MAG: hypothetical protein OXE53_19250, partial [Deltaproteobacteria bacterium]|nr:hypothetical protein [Deltaproteobacteria bacterium]